MQEQMPLERAKDAADYIRAAEDLRYKVLFIHRRYQENLPMWTIFNKQNRHFPGLFVCRLFLTLPQSMETEILVRAVDLKEIRDLFCVDLICLPRHTEDEPDIIETWI